MKRFNYPFLGILICILFVGIFIQEAHAQLQLTVVYPHEGQIVTATDSTFIFGQVTPPEAALYINNVQIPLHESGTYLAYLPIQAGDFTFNCFATLGRDSVRVLRSVTIPFPLTASTTDSLVFDSTFIYPQDDWELLAGDIFRVSVKGSPGCRGTFQIDDVTMELPMTEVVYNKLPYWGEAVFGSGAADNLLGVEGIYTGAYEIQPFDWVEKKKVRFRLVSTDGDTAEIWSKGTLTVRNSSVPVVGELVAEKTTARTGPQRGYHLFLPEGVMMHITGRKGSYYRTRLSGEEDVWIPLWNLRILPEGTLPPESVVSLVTTEDIGKKTRVRVFTTEKVPYKIEQIVTPSILIVTLYGITADTDWIRYDFNDALIHEIRWAQPARGVYRLRIELNQKQQWGYDVYYDGPQLILDIKKSPKIAGWPSSPLKGISILLDPGHGPDLGAIGPSGVTEKDVNMWLSETLKAKLEKKGANVYLSREDLQGISLTARPKAAAVIDADILLSLHHNALPDGVNPFTSRGTSTYYYHPQSRNLAYLIQEELLEKLGLNDFGLFYDNLALCRPTQMPAVLVEAAFLMHPEEEALVIAKEGRIKTAKAITEALEGFLAAARK